jgi:hypothetical protein
MGESGDFRPARVGLTVGDVTEAVVGIWRELFEDDDIDADTDFLALGGTSLLAVRFRTRVRSRLGRDLDLLEFFYAPTPREVAPLILRMPVWGGEAADAETAPTPAGSGRRSSGAD